MPGEPPLPGAGPLPTMPAIMKVTKEQSAANRQALVDAASKLYRERGIAGVGLAEISSEAGFTHGGFYGRFASKEELAAEACDQAFEASLQAGVNWVDTAEVYGQHTSERMLGRLMREMKVDVRVATKCFPLPWRWSGKTLLRALEGSLKRLEMQRVDLYQMHWPYPPVSVEAWMDDYAPSMGAALSYYTLFSIAPLLLIAVGVAGLVFAEDAARGEIFGQLRELMGDEGASAIERLLASADKPEGGVIATAVGMAVLLLGAMTVFGELQNALDRIWRAPARMKSAGWW